MSDQSVKVEADVLKSHEKRLPYQFQPGNPGGPGRPKGMKNKFTHFKEILMDAFMTEPGAMEALKQTLFEYDLTSPALSDGPARYVKKVNVEALRAIMTVLPKEKEDDAAGTINNSTLIIQLGNVSTEDLRQLALLAGTTAINRQDGAEGISET